MSNYAKYRKHCLPAATRRTLKKRLRPWLILLPFLGCCLILAAIPSAVRATEAAGSAGQAAGQSIWALKRWSPYAVGFGIGVLSWLVFLLSDNTLGASSAYARTAGMIEKAIRGGKVAQRAYYREHPPEIGWGWMLLIGLVIGSFLSAWLSGDFRIALVPHLWEQQTGSGAFLRWITALGGGMLLGIGSRWAEGCTSGHGISGTLQLVVSSWIAVICFFIGGVITAFILF
jgi:uncharacterized membrane protein YedE/YeeE